MNRAATLRAEDERLGAKARDLEEKSRRGERAESLIGDPLLQGAFTDLREMLDKAWLESEPAQGQLREDAWRARKLLDRIEGQLQKHMRDGSKAGHELLIVRKRREWIDRLLRRAA